MGRGFAWIGVIVFAISWFVPVWKGQDLMNAGRDVVEGLGNDADSPLKVKGPGRTGVASGPTWLPGWQACRVAWELLTGDEKAMQEGKDGKDEAWKAKVLGATCLTNALMLVSVLMLLGHRIRNPVLALLMLAAAGLNASWLYLGNSEFRSLLSTGYYLWAGSFLVVGLGLMGGRDRGALHPV